MHERKEKKKKRSKVVVAWMDEAKGVYLREKPRAEKQAMLFEGGTRRKR